VGEKMIEAIASRNCWFVNSLHSKLSNTGIKNKGENALAGGAHFLAGGGSYLYGRRSHHGVCLEEG
jgi:hypothetical protein